ncbi:MAG TPA: HAD hydrolase-like protein [Solirubrobacteraceae bacterium]
MRLDDAAGFVFDVDGTLVHRAGQEVRVVAGAAAVLERIRDSGRPYLIFTNGSHMTPEAFARGLRDVGLPVADDQLLTPLVSAIHHLRRRHPGALVRLFAAPAVERYMADAGIELAPPARAREADVVYVAHVDDVHLDELEEAARAVRAGAPLLTSSYVSAYSGANGPILSRGAMVTAAIAKASEARPKIVGKPSKAAVAVIGERLGLPTSQVAVIGDDLTMDVGLGHLGGSRTVLVRSGISGQIDLARVPERRRPHAVIGEVGELLAML